MQAISINTVLEVIRTFKHEIEAHQSEIQQKLFKLKAEPIVTGVKNGKEYIDGIIRTSSLITQRPDEINNAKVVFDSIIKGNEVKKHKRFRNSILEALDYNGKRNSFYPSYFKAIGINACVYCNSQLTVSIEPFKGKKDKTKAKFQVDHYYPKSEYPCFSVSLFNLYPVCASCNNSKRENYIDFDLYSENPTSSNFSFRIDDTSQAQYMLSRNWNDLKFHFTEPTPKKGFKKFEETFDISGIYDTQKDLAEELISKAEIYTDSYRNTLIQSFPEIFTKTNLSERLFIGNYVEEVKIHQRPMAKFTQDIAIQLGLLMRNNHEKKI